MSVQYLVPLVSVTVNGATIQQPKYFGTDFTGTFAAIPYGLEPICLLSLPAASAVLAAESDVYALPADLTQPMAGSDVATLAAFLAANNVPSDGIVAGAPFVTALVYVAQIFLTAQFIAGQTQSDLFTAAVSSPSQGLQAGNNLLANTGSSNGGDGSSLTLDSLFSDSAAAAVLTVQANPSQQSQQSQGLGSSPAPLFDFSNVQDTDTIGNVLDEVSQTWAGGPISLGGF